jgi:ribose transport system substrate-binding protein
MKMQAQIFAVKNVRGTFIPRRQRSITVQLTIFLLLVLVLSACGIPEQAGGPPGANTATASGHLPPIDPNNPQVALSALEQRVYSVGPYGEPATPASQVQLTSQELQKIQSMHAKAAIVLHYAGNDWSRAQVDGLKHQFAAMGIEVIAVTDANFDPNTQVADIETVLNKKPNIIVSIPTDPVATASAYRKVLAQGVKLVFMDNVPSGFKPGTDYLSVVSADNFGNGVAAALLMAKKLDGKGKIGLIYHAADFYVTKQRYEGFKAAIAKFPGIQIVSEKGVSGPDYTTQADTAASAMMTRYPDLKGIWAVWDVPAEGVLSAARNNGRPDLVVTTCDLGLTVAVEIHKAGIVYGLGAQRPFDQGTTEALLAGYGLLGKKTPPYVALNSLAVTRANVLQAWQAVYHQAPPPFLTAT